MSKQQYGIAMAFLLCLPISMITAQSTNQKYVPEDDGVRHLLVHPEPLYPPIAKAAHVQGVVSLHVSVDQTGKVTKVVAVNGPDMLKSAAIEGVSRWSYKPFEVNGVPQAAQVIVTVPFSLGIPTATEKSDEAVGQAYFPESDLCRSAYAQRDYSKAVTLCKQATETADRFPEPKLRWNEIRNAHQMYGQALLSMKDFAPALKEFNYAVSIANKSLTEKDDDYGSAYFSQALAEHILGQAQDAERDYSIAESSYRKAVVNLPEMKKPYEFSLARVLVYHSILEQQTGHPEASEKLKQEATDLDPSSLNILGAAK